MRTSEPGLVAQTTQWSVYEFVFTSSKEAYHLIDFFQSTSLDFWKEEVNERSSDKARREPDVTVFWPRTPVLLVTCELA